MNDRAPSIEPSAPRSPSVTCSGQVLPRHTGGAPYRCSLPGLAGFDASRCVGPNLQRRPVRLIQHKRPSRREFNPAIADCGLQGTATSPSSTAKASGGDKGICFVGAVGSPLNVQRVRLAGCLPAPPRIWTLLATRQSLRLHRTSTPFARERMAEGVGFEPTVQLPVHGISSAAPSATRPPLPSGRRDGSRRITQNRRFVTRLNLAEGRGFEPPRDLRPYPISSRTPSTGLGHPSAPIRTVTYCVSSLIGFGGHRSSVQVKSKSHGAGNGHGGYRHDLLDGCGQVARRQGELIAATKLKVRQPPSSWTVRKSTPATTKRKAKVCRNPPHTGGTSSVGARAPPRLPERTRVSRRSTAGHQAASSFDRPYLLLVNVAASAREPCGPGARAVAEHSAGRGVLFSGRPSGAARCSSAA